MKSSTSRLILPIIVLAVILGGSTARAETSLLPGPPSPQGSAAAAAAHERVVGRSVAKTAAFYLSGQALDYGLTEYGLSRGLKEGNLLMRERSARTAVSLWIAGAFTWYDLQEKNKRRRRAVRVFYFVSQAAVVGWNVRQITKQRR